MHIIKTEIKVGAEKPFSVMHASDTHLTLADARDGKRKTDLAERRQKTFPEADEMFEKMVRLQKKTGSLLVHTGDLIDFVSLANLEKAAEFTAQTDCFFAAGNHEFSLYVGEAKEDAAYREQSLAKVQAAFANDIRFSSRVVNGVNFVAADNSYYLMEESQLNALKAEAEKGLPVVLCVHTPLFSEGLYDYLLNKEGKNSPAYLMSVPEEKMRHYTPDRYEQQKEDAATHEAYEFIRHCPQIKAILAGHVHCPFAFEFGDKMQYGVGCTDIRLIDFT